MKNLIFILCLVLVFTGCTKNNASTKGNIQSQGVITGDYLGPCPNSECGGIEISIKSDTTSSSYMIYSSFSKLGITDSTKFPINVNLNWAHDTMRGGDYIVVSQLTVVK